MSSQELSQIQTIEKNIISLIRRRGGKVALSALVFLYKEEFKTESPVPPRTKLIKWVKQFNAIRMDFYHQINQWYLFEKGVAEQIYCIENNRNDVEEGNIITLLQQNKHRIKLNEVGSKYKSMFNTEMSIPQGMQLWEWFKEFSRVDVEFNSQNNQSYLILRPKNDFVKEEEKNILHILEHNDGCIGINDMVKIFKESHKRDIVLAAQNAKSGKKMKLVEWLCSLNSVVLTRKPFKNQMFVALKHSVQCQYDIEVSKSTNNEEIATEDMFQVNSFEEDAGVKNNNIEALATASGTGAEMISEQTYDDSTELSKKRKRNGEERANLQNGTLVAKEINSLYPTSENSKSTFLEVKVAQPI